MNTEKRLQETHGDTKRDQTLRYGNRDTHSQTWTERPNDRKIHRLCHKQSWRQQKIDICSGPLRSKENRDWFTDAQRLHRHTQNTPWVGKDAERHRKTRQLTDWDTREVTGK